MISYFCSVQSTKILGIFVGSIFAILGILMFVRYILDHIQNKLEVEAVVTKLQKTISNGVSRNYHYVPILSYHVQNKQYNEIYQGRKVILEIGTKVKIKVNENKPKRFYVVGDQSLLIKAIITSILGIACIVVLSIA